MSNNGENKLSNDRNKLGLSCAKLNSRFASFVSWAIFQNLTGNSEKLLFFFYFLDPLTTVNCVWKNLEIYFAGVTVCLLLLQSSRFRDVDYDLAPPVPTSCYCKQKGPLFTMSQPMIVIIIERVWSVARAHNFFRVRLTTVIQSFNLYLRFRKQIA